ncbi:putative membrane protein [Catenulispora sp. GP43]|uniref:SHOCT domain-containing protein n=1 Tax=Catenulispora sp. GP43 TaxID=3156263 RepID=UPI003512DEEA
METDLKETTAMMYQYGHHGIGAWGFLMTLGMLAFWALLIAVGVTLYRLSSAHAHLPTAPPPDQDAEQVLARRFAAGEIDEKEYTARLTVLHGQPPQQPGGS